MPRALSASSDLDPFFSATQTLFGTLLDGLSGVLLGLSRAVEPIAKVVCDNFNILRDTGRCGAMYNMNSVYQYRIWFHLEF